MLQVFTLNFSRYKKNMKHIFGDLFLIASHLIGTGNIERITTKRIY